MPFMAGVYLQAGRRRERAHRAEHGAHLSVKWKNEEKRNQKKTGA